MTDVHHILLHPPNLVLIPPSSPFSVALSWLGVNVEEMILFTRLRRVAGIGGVPVEPQYCTQALSCHLSSSSEGEAVDYGNIPLPECPSIDTGNMFSDVVE